MLRSSQMTARSAGFLYLLIIATGLTAEFVLRAPFAVDEAPGAIADALRYSAGADAVMILADVGLAILLFALLRGVGTGLALAAMVFRLVQAVCLALGLLILLAGANGVLTPPVALQLHAEAYDVGLLFFGVNSVLTGLLLMRIGGVGRALGAGLIAAGIVYLTGSTLRIVAPDLVAAVQPAYLIAVLAEVSLCLWLLAGAPQRSNVAQAAM